MTSTATRLRTYWALGPSNLARVATYRARLRLRAFPSVPKPESAGENELEGDYFKPPKQRRELASPVGWLHEGELFGWFFFPVGTDAPDWLTDPITGKRHHGGDKPWFELADFDTQFGDIKPLWELSRFGWALPMARRFALGNAREGARLNAWIRNWNEVNPAWRGPNWKCGQEASIRVLHLAMVARELGSPKETTVPLRRMLRNHLRRIASSLSYARAQDNNHGTSEAAALYVGGSWLAQDGCKLAKRWRDTGRAAIEERVDSLVAPDGSFSQHSVVYHRMLLDTLVMVELWRSAMGDFDFTAAWNTKAIAATKWLDQLIFSCEGDCPNLGANDGAHLFRTDDTPYRDFRPSVMRAKEVFALSSSSTAAVRGRQFDDGGYVMLGREDAKVLFRYARFRFRPSQADVNHVDFWLGGDAVFRDGGTYSYNDVTQQAEDLAEVQGHNTLQFGTRPQMPRIGRFLLGDWLDAGPVTCNLEAQGVPQVVAGYVDRTGARHRRSVHLTDKALDVEDQIEGANDRPIFIRWRLRPGNWTVKGNEITGEKVNIQIKADAPISLRLCSGHESTHYLQISNTPVLEIVSSGARRVLTSVTW